MYTPQAWHNSYPTSARTVTGRRDCSRGRHGSRHASKGMAAACRNVDDLEGAVLATQAAMDATSPDDPLFGTAETARRARLRKWSDATGRIPESEIQVIGLANGGTWIPPELAQGRLGLHAKKTLTYRTK
jgi:hypothetical protein